MLAFKSKVLAASRQHTLTSNRLKVQATLWRRRRARASMPPQAATMPGRPAPTIGPGTLTLDAAKPVAPDRGDIKSQKVPIAICPEGLTRGRVNGEGELVVWGHSSWGTYRFPVVVWSI